MEQESLSPRPTAGSSANTSLTGVTPVTNRLRQYKMTTPPWKETLRQNCFQRIKNERQRLVDRFRNGDCGEANSEADQARSVLDVEINNIKDSLSDSEIEFLDSVYHEVLADLQAEARRLMAKQMYLEQAALNADIEQFCSDSVICPQCQKSDLHLVNLDVCDRISCSSGCTFAADVPQSYQNLVRNPSQLRDYFASLHAQHQSNGCLLNALSFRHQEDISPRVLWAGCDQCKFCVQVFP